MYVINPYVATIVSYCVAVSILAIPILNALGADVKNVASILAVNGISFTALALFGAVVASGWISSHERHSHPMLCVLHACGIPGLILALFAAVAP